MGLQARHPSQPAAPRPAWGRAPSSGGADRRAAGPPPSTSSRPRQPSNAGPSNLSDSWRSKTDVQAPSPAPVVVVKTTSVVVPPPPTTLAGPQAFDVQAGDDLEVVDFNDLGKLVGEPKGAQPSGSVVQAERPQLAKPARPVASDFFQASESRSKAEQETWRRAVPPKEANQAAPVTGTIDAKDTPEQSSVSELLPANQPASASHSPVKRPFSEMPPSPSMPTHHAINGQGGVGPRFQRVPSNPYREAPLSALDDTMSRIKGALDGMQSSLSLVSVASKSDVKDATDAMSTVQPSASPQSRPIPPVEQVTPKNKWLPPPLRAPVAVREPSPTEPFGITRVSPPQSPRPTGHGLVVSLPKTSRRVEPLPKRQANSAKLRSFPVRWEILSFDPPVEGMSKVTFSLNDVLFKKPQVHHKTKLRYKVTLPKKRIARQLPLDSASGSQAPQTGPKVNLPPGPSTKSNAVGAFGRPRKADQDNWRSVSTVPGLADIDAGLGSGGGLNVTSRSPPPEPMALLRTESVESDSSLAQDKTGKAKAPQMPDGAEVAFYKNVRKEPESIEIAPKVTFLVTSELEGVSESIPARVNTMQGTERILPGSQEVRETPGPSSLNGIVPSEAGPGQTTSQNAKSAGLTSKGVFSDMGEQGVCA